MTQSVDDPLLADVVVSLMVDGLPLEAAQKFAVIAVDAVRNWLWREPGGCRCGSDWVEHGSEDPSCWVHQVDRALGGDGSGGMPLVHADREGMAMVAANLKEGLGDEVYGRVFAPVFAERLVRVARTEEQSRG